MKTSEYIQWLERMIQGCNDLGGMEREKSVYQNCLKKVRQINKKPHYQNVISKIVIDDLEIYQYSITVPKMTYLNTSKEKIHKIYNKLIEKIVEVEWVNAEDTGRLVISFRNMLITDEQKQIVVDVINDVI